jgi:hypothetical protein
MGLYHSKNTRVKIFLVKGPVLNNGRGGGGGGGGGGVRKGGRLQLFLPELGAASNWKICDKRQLQLFNTFLLIFSLSPLSYPTKYFVYAVHRSRSK